MNNRLTTDFTMGRPAEGGGLTYAPHAGAEGYFPIRDNPPAAQDGKVAIPGGWEVEGGECVRTYRIEDAPAPVKTYSKRRLMLELAARGLWDAVEAWMRQTELDNGVNCYELFSQSQDLASDDADFSRMRAAAGSLATENEIGEILALCEI